MWNSLSRSISAHLVSTMFRIPSGPGALYGLILWSCLFICTLVIGSTSLHGSLLVVSSCVNAGCSGLGRKKQLASALPFSSFVTAFLSVFPLLHVSTGILDLPPSVGCEDVSLCAVHMSGSSALSIQSLQCCCLLLSRLLRYSFTASPRSACFLYYGYLLTLLH